MSESFLSQIADELRNQTPPADPAPVEPASVEPAPVEPTPAEPTPAEPTPAAAVNDQITDSVTQTKE